MKKLIVSLFIVLVFTLKAHALAPMLKVDVDKSVDDGPEVCTNADLPNYIEHKFKGDELGLSESYARRYLHLVAPEHPMNKEIEAAGKKIEGRDSSLIMRIPQKVVQSSGAYRALVDEIMADEALSRKLALMDSSKLHITVAVLSDGIDMRAMEEDGTIERVRKSALAAGPFRVQVRGPWISGWSEGRIYLLAYPEIVDEDKGKTPGSGRRSVMGQIQKELWGRDGNFFSVGFAGIKDALTKEETVRLKRIFDKYLNADEPLFDFTANELSVICSTSSLFTLADIEKPETIIPLTDDKAVENAA